MPIARISFDHRLDATLAACSGALIQKLSTILAQGLASERASPQVVLQPGAYISQPFLIYVDLQFRATMFRDQGRVQRVLKDMASVLDEHFHCPVRLRGFAIDQATLSAIDHKPGGEKP